MEPVFTYIDYIMLFVMLAISVCMGIYFGYFSKQSTASDYLLGGKSMSSWSISFSLVSSALSGSTLLLIPAETYQYGIQYGLISISVIAIQILSYYIYLPVFYKLQLTSAYEYLELRFSNKVRVFASIVNTFFMFIYLPVVIYIPAIIISMVAGINPHVVTVVTCAVCIFYTTLGGIKVVIWTDVLQFTVMFFSIFIIIVLGVIKVGGIENIWNLNYQSQRLQIDYDLDMTKRTTIWGAVISNMGLWMNLITTGQSSVQKYMSLPSFKDVKKTVCISTPPFVLLLGFTFIIGSIIYARYHDCDPILSGEIKSINQILPYFVLDVGGSIPGLPGLFTSGIISATLSTLSAGLNCLATTIYSDFISPFSASYVSEKNEGLLLKLLVLTIGVICTSLVYVIEQLGDLFPVILSVMGLTGGPLVGIFTAGMCLPIVNTKGIMAGGITSFLVLAWMIFGSQWYQYKNVIRYPGLPTSVKGCHKLLNMTQSAPQPAGDDVLFVYRISHFHYPMIGIMIVIIVSVIISYLTKDKDHHVDKDCIAPFAQCMIPRRNIVEASKVNKSIDLLNVEENIVLLKNFVK